MALALAAPAVVAEPAVPGALQGSGTASTFTVYASGASFEGGLAQRTHACRDCLIQIAFTDVAVTLVQDGQSTSLVPGSYEIRGFAGTFSYTWRAPHVLDVQLQGVGAAARLDG